MRDLGRIGHFVAGAVGPPGRRVFLLEVDAGPELEWYLVEKEQVAALAAAAVEYLTAEATGPRTPGPELSDPGDPVFRVGRIGLGEAGDLIAVELHPLSDDRSEPVAFRVERTLLGSMADRALLVVAAGRPPCPMCGLPRDPDGHTCPSSNGDLRRGS
jgi:uncharacterized repeat protein (TIGR03847 family)